MSEPQQVTVAGFRLRCQHCGHEGFDQATTSLNRYPLGFLQLGGILGHQATMYSCTRCGFLHWFFSVPSAEHETRDLPDAG
jgi:DNA-directed RNA polymerase subunit RPC12/RpoP